MVLLKSNVFVTVPKVPRKIGSLSRHLRICHLSAIVSKFLYMQDNPDDICPPDLIPLEDCPRYTGKVMVYPSAVTTYRAPSDLSGSGSMRYEHIRSVPSWRDGPPRQDCVFIAQDSTLHGFRGLFVGQVEAFIKLKHKRIKYPCAVVSTFSPLGDSPCPDTGMWIVERDLDESGEKSMMVVHVDAIIRGAHLMGVAGDAFIPHDLGYSDSLNAFKTFYVNKYIDYHAHEIAF
jgi:hypothetical protein